MVVVIPQSWKFQNFPSSFCSTFPNFKGRQNMVEKFFVVEQQVMDICNTYEQAVDIADEWSQGFMDNLRDADEYDIKRVAEMPDCGLETGDIQIVTLTWENDEDYTSFIEDIAQRENLIDDPEKSYTINDAEKSDGCRVARETYFDGHSAIVAEAYNREANKQDKEN